ncbi:hypothetical protein V491_06714 [Pseudogymnoascus sp. VKM F-3775]|nr:hypothetical protein V491_06714 [Pseudogymnoascus sp. VKM F-3775]
MHLSAFALLAILTSANALTDSAPISPINAVTHTVNLFNGVNITTATVGHPDIPMLPGGPVRAVCVLVTAVFSWKDVVAALRRQNLYKPMGRSGTSITVWRVVMPLNHVPMKNAGSSLIMCLGVTKGEEGLIIQGGCRSIL